MIFGEGAASAVTSSARVETTCTFSGGAAAPPVVPVPSAAHPSLAGSTCRPSGVCDESTVAGEVIISVAARAASRTGLIMCAPSDLSYAGARSDDRPDVVRVVERVVVVIPRLLDGAAAVWLARLRACEHVVPGHTPARGTGVVVGHRLLDVVELVALDYAAGVRLAGHPDVRV